MFKQPRYINEQGTIYAEYLHPEIMGNTGVMFTAEDTMYYSIVVESGLYGEVIPFERPAKPNTLLAEGYEWQWDGVDSWVEMPVEDS
jgi:hypothetical protein